MKRKVCKVKILLDYMDFQTLWTFKLQTLQTIKTWTIH
jgi:hypothetical protein